MSTGDERLKQFKLGSGVLASAERPLLLVNIRQLLTLQSDKPGPRRGRDLNDLGIIENAAVLCLGGKIVSVGTTKEALRDPWLKKMRKRLREVDCSGHVVIPGFVDSHTHPVFTAPRLIDFERRISGATYEQIAEAGGGIRSSLQGVRAAGKSPLAGHVLRALRSMTDQGTTTVEAKSGYGLTVKDELKSLEAIRDAGSNWPGTLVATLLGAHVVPPEFKARSQKYVEAVCKKMIPEAARRNLAVFVDVFTERGAFSIEDTKQIFRAAVDHGLGTRAHVCQLGICALEPLLEYEPSSLDHLDHVSEEDIARMAKKSTVATLVPGANYFLGLQKYPPARKLVEAGVPVALASDYNPGSSPTTSMPFVLSLACTHMRMTPAEAISCATVNGAHALQLASRKGTIEPGKDADLAAFQFSDYREIPYWFAAHRCAFTVLNGTFTLAGKWMA